MSLRVVRPSAALAESFAAALGEFYAEGQLLDVAQGGVAAHLHHLRLAAVFPAPGGVPESEFWGEVEGVFVGRVTLHHRLTSELEAWGGHIGYQVRPSQRGQGYGHALLRGVLPEAATLGLTRVLLTCDEGNLASRRVIEGAGGVLEDVRPGPSGAPKRRYWIELPTGPRSRLDVPS